MRSSYESGVLRVGTTSTPWSLCDKCLFAGCILSCIKTDSASGDELANITSFASQWLIANRQGREYNYCFPIWLPPQHSPGPVFSLVINITSVMLHQPWNDVKATVCRCCHNVYTTINRSKPSTVPLKLKYSDISCRWLNARLQYLQCVSNGDNAVLQWAIDLSLTPILVTRTLLCPYHGFQNIMLTDTDWYMEMNFSCWNVPLEV